MPCHRLIVFLFTLATSLSAQATPLADIIQLHKKGKPEQALQELDSYLASLPKDSWGRNVTQARFLKGVILAEQKRTAEAIRIFNKLTLDYPDLPEPYNNLAALYVSQGKYEAARDTLERAMQTDPAYAALHNNLNDIYAKLSAHAYENTLASPSGTAQERIRELCENYGKIASQVAGRKITPHADADFRLIRDISAGRTAAAEPPAHVEIDDMAMEDPAAEEKPVRLPTRPVSPQPAQTPNTSGNQQAILKALQDWSSAWSNKNIKGYLACYAPDFKLPGGGTRAAWAAQRRARIEKPKSIRVEVETPKIQWIDDTHAHVTFRQSYRSDALQTTSRKTLVMKKSAGRWLIQEEMVGN